MKIAILGFGVVGRGAYEVAKDSGCIEVVKILARHPIAGYDDLVTQNFEDIISDSDIDLVAECIGGTDPAYEYVVQAMQAGKHVVTPNKNLVSAHYNELLKCAADNGVEFRFTPTSGGGIPWLFNLMRTKRCDTITEVRGIVNGTCNYILDAMHSQGAAFDETLAKAQELGYAEADPTADIGGMDSLRKCVISANIAFDCTLDEAALPCYGIQTIDASDIEYFRDRGYTCKLLMSAGVSGDKVYAFVEPTLVTSEYPESAVHTNYNMITLTGQNNGTLAFYGQGAGKLPTGASLVHDMMDICTGIPLAASAATGSARELDNDSVKHSYYFHVKTDAGFPLELAEEKIEKGRDLYIITKPLSVNEAHALAREYGESSNLFMAGIMI